LGSADVMLIAGLLLMGWAVYLFVKTLMGEKSGQPALDWGSIDAPEKSKNSFLEFSRPLVHRFALHWAMKIKAPGYRASTKKRIATAGLERYLNVDEYIGLQILWGVMFPVLLLLMNFAFELGNSPGVIAIFGVLGGLFPQLYVSSEKKRRYLSVVVDLPYFIDILALSTEAGLDFIGSIQRVCDKADNSSVLASEFGQVLQDIKLGQSRAEALRAMANRLDMSEITSFIAVLVDADATGASIGGVLKQQSIQMRVERFTRAEKAGARASQAILIPLMLFILPAVFIMVFGPVVLQFMGGGMGK
jgi:tight adherence protein C